MAELLTKYQQYAEYKDSGVEWLDVIPSHWVMSKIKYIAPFQVGWTPPTGNDSNFIGENIWANISDLRGKVINDTVKRISDKAAKEASMDITPKGSLLYSFKLSVGSVSFAGCDMYTNEAIASFTSDSLLPLEYLYYVLPKFLIENASTNIYGARILNQELIRNAIILKPTYDEAKIIANFLDHETAQIDTLIEKQQTLIQLLKEKRQAVISHAVTKGLSPDAPMKDSGVEWLGEVPEHWVVLRLKHLISSLDSGCSVNAADIPAQENEIGVLKTSCVYTRAFRVEENKTVFKEDLSRVKCPIRKGAIIISRMNTPDLVGASAIIGVDADNIFLPDRLWQTNFNNDFDLVPDFLAYFMTIKGFRNQISLAAEGASSSMQSISKEDYLSINCILPPIKEQQEIIKHIEEMQSKFNDLVENAEQAIQLMQERRTALISAAVTGKIDVRGWRVSDANYESH